MKGWTREIQANKRTECICGRRPAENVSCWVWPRQMVSSTGLCRYGARIDCCWGWTRRSWGHCQPLCQHGCKYGECIGPNKCRCFPGYTGKACNQDLNECGLKPRPCKHRCMNTYGSYKCYCLSGYMMMPDGTCGNAHTCALANCQYGCGVVKGEVRCQCPSPGLQLGSDGRTCVDVDECSLGRAMCPRFRKCINTFGSYVCRCHEGFELRYISGKYHCADVNECSSGQHRCAGFATCHNTPGSYKCKCTNGFGTPGSSCKTIPKVIIDPPRPGNVTNNTGNGNWIPDSNSRGTVTTPGPTNRSSTPKAMTPSKRPTQTLIWTPTISTHHPPFATRAPPIQTRHPAFPTRAPPIPTRHPASPTWAPAIPTRRPASPTRAPPIPTRRPAFPTQASPIPTHWLPNPTTSVPEVSTGDNKIQKSVTQKQRGDVHIPRNHGHNNVFDFDIELGNTAEELRDDSGFLSCAFDNGLCGWIRDREGDLHWETITDPSGGKYLTIPEVVGKKRGRGACLVLPLTKPWNSGNICLSFRHKLEGHHVGMLQVFVGKGKQNSPAVWGRTGGKGWRSTQITLWASGLESFAVLGSRRRTYARGREKERNLEECLTPSVKLGGGSIMVWGCYGAGKVGSLHRVQQIMN
uniref:Nephronectin n=1 Tax=Scleropages formosus TaxID=113540 RepID=A0A8C9RYK0_SCLFO